MRITQFTTNESRRALGPILTEARQYKLWESAGRKLVEYKLTDQQVAQIFQQVEKGMTDAGGNRTMLGQGKDAVSAVNQAWEQLKGEIQNSKPIKGVDGLYDQAAAKLKSATGGDEGLMKYVQKYRDFAKKHPIAQSFIYAALAAAVGLTTAGLGAPAALGLLRMTDKLLQGEKFSSAAYAGGKTAAMSMLAKFFKHPDAELPQDAPPVKLPDGTDYVVQKGDTLSQIAQRNGVSVKDLMAANDGATTTTDLTTQGWNNDYHDAFSNQDAMGNYTGPTNHEYATVTNPHITNPDVLKPGQTIKIPGSLGPTQTYAGGVGTAADTWDKVKDGTYSASEISRNQAAKWGLDGAGKYNAPDIAGSVGDTADTASNAATDAATNMTAKGAASASDAADSTNYADSKTNPWDKANAKVDADVAQSQADADAINAKNSAEYSDALNKNPGSPVAYDDNGDMMPGFKQGQDGMLRFDPDKASTTSSGTGPYDDGASQLGQNPDITKVADTNQGRLKMNQWRMDNGSPNATPDSSAADAASAMSSNTPTLSLTDTGNGIKGDLTLPGGETVPATAYPSDGIQPRMPFGSEKVTVDLNGQKVDAWIYNGKAYIKDFDTSALKAPAEPASTGSPFFDRMNRAAANGVKLRESQVRALFAISTRAMLSEGIWDSIKSGAGKAADWAKTKGHNMTTKVTADKLNTAWEKINKPLDSAAIIKLLTQNGIPQPVIDAAMKAVMGAGQQAQQEPPQAQAQAQQQPQGQQDELGRTEPTMDAPAKTQPQGQQQPQGQSVDLDQLKAKRQAAQQAQPQGFAGRGIAGMDAAPAKAQAQPEQPGFLQSKIKKGGYTYQPEMTEEMIAKDLHQEWLKMAGHKPKARDILKRPKDRDIQKKAKA